MPSESETGRIKEYWGSTHAAQWRSSNILHWLEHPQVQSRINFLASGNAAKDRFQYFIERYFGSQKAARVLTLGCGHGEFERGLSGYHFAVEHDAIDLAEGAIEDASKQARDLELHHIHYSVADLNTVQLPANRYDVVFGISSIHHVARLEHLFEQVSRSLKPGGYFFLDEYVGPTKFRWTRKQLRIINDLLKAMPADLRRSIVTGKQKEKIRRCSIKQMNVIDPSEAIRSKDIEKLLPQYFEVIENKGMGGSILHLLLEGIAGNFDQTDTHSMEYLQSLFDEEDRLIANHTLEHDFAIIICQAKSSPHKEVRHTGIAGIMTKAKSLIGRSP